MSLPQSPLASVARSIEVGFYGKLPSHGDFLRRRVSDAFVSVWDAWLQACVAASRDALADRWLDIYLTSPAWRFVCAAGACGPAPVAGVMVPSVDRVGRYFPLTLVAALPASVNLISVPAGAELFFDNAERIVVDALGAERVDFDGFDLQVSQLSADLAAIAQPSAYRLDPGADAILSEPGVGRWQLPLGAGAQLQVAFQQLLGYRLEAAYQPLSLWWTSGSSIVEPGCLIDRGLPDPDSFVALLDGSWTERQWRTVPAQLDVAPAPEILIDDATAPMLRSVAASDVGRVREINQDAFIERPEVGIWAVADGVGGHSHGEVASRMVCDAIADLTPSAGFDDVIDAVRDRLSRVNAHLVREAGQQESRRSGSTVVVLLTRGSRCAILWAGDSRVYRWRDGRLIQMTRDHSVAEAAATEADADSHAITRAVGGDATLELEEIRDHVLPGDRFLLCTDGLTREVSEVKIRFWLEQSDLQTAVDGLIGAALQAGARDNVTALIVGAVA